MKTTITILAMVLCASVANADSNRDVVSAYEAVRAGRNLTDAEVSDLEAALVKNPDDLPARIKLLGYYDARQFASAEARSTRRNHILWIIKNRPEAVIAGLPDCTIDAILDHEGYREAKGLWLDQTTAHSQEVAVLGHAAKFFLLHDRELAEDLLVKAQKLAPNDAQWPDALGHLYALGTGDKSAAQALAQFEKAQGVDTSDESKYYRLTKLAKTAFDAGEVEKASLYANELLAVGANDSRGWNAGNAVHHGNNVLGRIALRTGDVKKASEFLLKAGQTPGSPQLNSFGPNMMLAKELLQAGEKNVVLDYFERCRKFWKSGGKRLDGWAEDVKADRAPEFGANLRY